MMNVQAQKIRSKNLSHYEILGPLGRGSNSFVYKAKYIFTNNIVALKVIDITTPERLRKAKKEVKIHKSLNHESIVSYIDDFKDDSYWYLVLEYCEKGELYSYLKRKNLALAESEIRSIGLQLLKALEYLENHKIMHLDIKLGNILLKQSIKIKLSDFGFSEKIQENKTRGSHKQSDELFKEGLKLCDNRISSGFRSKSQTPLNKNIKLSFIQGTPNYIAPELLEKGQKSFKSDIWSLGCVLYALGAGKTPFEGKSMDHTFDNIMNNAIKFPSHFSNNFIELLQNMLEPKVKLRRSPKELMKMPFFATKELEDNTLSTIATDLDVNYRKESVKKQPNEIKPSYLNQVDKKTIHDIVKKSNIARNKSLNTELSDKTLVLPKSIKSKRLINEMLAKQSNLASTLNAQYIIGKLDNIGKISINRNIC